MGGKPSDGACDVALITRHRWRLFILAFRGLGMLLLFFFFFFFFFFLQYNGCYIVLYEQLAFTLKPGFSRHILGPMILSIHIRWVHISPPPLQ